MPGRNPSKRGEYYLGYFSRQTPSAWPFELHQAELANGMQFTVEVIGTWNMTITPAGGVFEVNKKDNYTYIDREGRSVPLPGKPYMSLRIRRVNKPVTGTKE